MSVTAAFRGAATVGRAARVDVFLATRARGVAALAGFGPRGFTARVAGQFPMDLARVDIVARTKEDGLAHHAVARPLGELDLHDQFRFHPGRFLVGMRWRSAEGRFLDDERLHQLVELGERPFIETAADVAGVDELAVLVDADDKRAEIFPAGAGRGEAADDDLLLKDGLDLQPGTTANARLIGAVAQLGDDPLQALLFGRFEEGRAFSDNVLGIFQQRAVGKQVTEQPLSVFERHLEEPLAVGIDQIEHDVQQRPGVSLPVLQ